MATFSYPFPSYNWQYQGFDYAGITGMDQALAHQMYGDGVRFVGRYLWSGGKGITAQEAEWYINAGIAIFLIYEVSGSDALGGQERGVQNGQAALALAAALNVPENTPIFCCCDTGVTDADANGVVMNYLAGFASQMGIYRTGIYGGLNVMSACDTAYPGLMRWQAGAWGAQEYSPIDIRQWLLGTNNRAHNDGYIRISNVTIDSSTGYAYWRGHNVDLCSTDDMTDFWGNNQPKPTKKKSMPIWMMIKPF